MNEGVEKDVAGQASVEDVSGPGRTIFGFPVRWVAVTLILALLFVWTCWLTVQVRENRQQQIVSVSLATIMADFVTAESAKTQSDEAMAMRTKLYLNGVEQAMEGLSEDYVVLLSEAVAGNSVPDVTPEVMAAVKKELDGAPGVGSIAQ